MRFSLPLLLLLLGRHSSRAFGFTLSAGRATVEQRGVSELKSWPGSTGYLDQLAVQETANKNTYENSAEVNGESFSTATTTSTTTATYSTANGESMAPQYNNRNGYENNHHLNECWSIQQQQQEAQQKLERLQLQQSAICYPTSSTSTVASSAVSSTTLSATTSSVQTALMNSGPTQATHNSNGDSFDAQYQHYYQNQQQQQHTTVSPMNGVVVEEEDFSTGNTDSDNIKQIFQGEELEQAQETLPPQPTTDQPISQDPTTTTNTGTGTGTGTGTMVDAEMEEMFLKMMSSEINVKRFLGQNPYAITDVPVDVVVQGWLDSMEDAVIQLKNKNANGNFKQDRPTVVVLGSGWAAHAFVKISSDYDLKVIVVSPVNHFVFTPMLASAAVGTVEYRSMTEPIRRTNPNIHNYIEGKAIGIDVENKQLTLQLTFSSGMDATSQTNPKTPTPNNNGNNIFQLDYDYLLCAVGTGVRSSMIPGAQQYCYNLKTSQDSKILRTAIGEALENASRPDVQEDFFWKDDCEVNRLARSNERKRRVRFVIIGGGPTGVELAGELNDFLQEQCRPKDGAYQRLKDEVSVTLVHGGADLLPQFDPMLRNRALLALQKRGVEVRLNTRTTEVGPDFVQLLEKGEGKQEEVIPCGLTVWAAGNEPVPFVKELLSKLPEHAAGTAGRINTDKWLRCPTPTPETFGSIMIMGDAGCLTAMDEKGEPIDASLPQTAQVAGQQGAFAARLLNRGYDMTQTPPRLPESMPFDRFSKLRVWLLVRGLEEAPDFAFLNLGMLAYVGGGEALTQVQIGDVPIFNLAGKRSFALWRSVYLAKQAASRNQAQLVFDWTRTQIFGRDITRL